VVLLAFAFFVTLIVPVSVRPSVQINVKELEFLKAHSMT
jgi:hypothetical protein